MPAPIILRNLVPDVKRVDSPPAGQPKISTRADLRDGSRGGGGAGSVEPGVPTFTLAVSATTITATVSNGNGADTYQIRVDLGVAIDGLTASGLAPETSYSIQVRGVNENGVGAWSGGVNVSTLAQGAASENFTPVLGYFVSGDFSAIGGEIVIEKSGGGFGVKPNGEKPVACLLWEDGHDSLSTNATLSRAAVNPTDEEGVVQSVTTPNGGVNAVQYNYKGASSPAIFGYVMPVASQKKLWFARTRINWTPDEAYANGGTNFNQKWWRIWAATENNNLILPAYGQSGGTGAPRITQENTQPGGSDWTGPSLLDFYNTWADEQAMVLESTIDGDDGEMRYAVAGTLYVSSGRRTRTASKPEYYSRFFAPQEQNAGWALTSWRYWSSLLYLDDSWCHAVLTDSATYNEASSAKEVQPIQKWADGSITIYARPKAGLTHLHVIDNDRNSYYIGERG